jgi:hypothetical protein
MGKAKTFNLGSSMANGEHLVFVTAPMKFSRGWLEALLEKCGDTEIVGAVTHTLDADFWASQPNRWKRYGWRWDLNVYDRVPTSDESPALKYCYCIKKERFKQLGKFDDGMCQGDGEDIELTLKNWLNNGRCLVADKAIVSTIIDAVEHPSTVNNLGRIIDTWFPSQKSHFLNARNIAANDINTGRLNLLQPNIRNSEWFLKNIQPELKETYDLYGTGTGKSVAIVAPGPSLNTVDFSLIYKHDIIIGIDYVPTIISCNYVVSDELHAVQALLSRYNQDRMLLPLGLRNNSTGTLIRSKDVVPECSTFELAPHGYTVSDINPPFVNMGNIALSAVHLALFLKPAYISVFGLDGRLIGGASHTSKTEYYNDGKLWTDSENLKQQFALMEYGLATLGNLAHSMRIPLIRITHA